MDSRGQVYNRLHPLQRLLHFNIRRLIVEDHTRSPIASRCVTLQYLSSVSNRLPHRAPSLPQPMTKRRSYEASCPGDKDVVTHTIT